MSRHTIPAKAPDLEVVVGWDNPMSTYFAIVERQTGDDDDDPVILWLGSRDRDYQRAEDMIDPLAPFADLTNEMIATLRNDRAETLDRGPTPLQRTRCNETDRGVSTLLQAPIVNLNGTSRRALLESYTTVLESLRRAENALATITPHGRDYPGDDTAYCAAVTQHHQRRLRLEGIIKDIWQIAKRIARAGA